MSRPGRTEDSNDFDMGKLQRYISKINIKGWNNPESLDSESEVEMVISRMKKAELQELVAKQRQEIAEHKTKIAYLKHNNMALESDIEWHKQQVALYQREVRDISSHLKTRKQDMKAADRSIEGILSTVCEINSETVDAGWVVNSLRNLRIGIFSNYS